MNPQYCLLIAESDIEPFARRTRFSSCRGEKTLRGSFSGSPIAIVEKHGENEHFRNELQKQ
jgi:hypothetical protein